jgi:predicted enzyme related to lactoylglutathione lyase
MTRFVHFEIPAQDKDKIAAFYRDTFGWTVSKWDGPVEYWGIITGEEGTPGINGALYQPGNGISGTVNTVQVDDIDAYLEKVKAAGGSVAHPKQTIPTAGYVAYCKDVEGNLFGLWQDDPNAGQ